MKDQEEQGKRYSMFYPKTKRGLLSDYPELKKIESFSKLSRAELLFVWYYACKASPFYGEENDEVRVKKALKESFGKTAGLDITSRYVAGNFVDKIRTAITEISRFEPGPRIRAKMMVEKILANYEKLIDVNVNGKVEFTNKDGEIDWSKKKAYIDACNTVSKALPTLITQSEGGFGITEVEEGETIELNSEDLIDVFHGSTN